MSGKLALEALGLNLGGSHPRAVDRVAKAIAAAEARGRAAVLAGCVPVPRELFERVVAALRRDIWTELAAELRAIGERKP